MKCEILHLKDFFPVLGENGCDATVTAYVLDDIVESNRSIRKRPSLLICPGGAYVGCSPREAEPVAVHFLEENFNVFTLHYSTIPHHFPIQIQEVAASIELIHKNERWNCDPQKTVIMGLSAGGHLAAYYANAYDCSEVRAVIPNSRPVQAAVLCYPVITADPKWGHLVSFDALTGTSERTIEENQKLSCELLVDEHTPPTFLWHTAADGCVPVMNSLLYAQKLAQYAVPFELHVYPSGEHGLSTCDEMALGTVSAAADYDRSWLECAKKWLRHILRGC